jgi:3-oxoadipate enol-lactonase
MTLPRLESFTAGPAGAPWVTFVPGIGNDATFWSQQAEALAAGFRTLRFEPWGCGGSDAPPTDCSIELIADGIVAMWDRLGINRSSMVGLGFGGSTALLTAIRHPSRVERVVACCCRPRQPDDRRQFWHDRAATARAEGLSGLADVTVERWLAAEFRAAQPATDESLRAAFRRNSVDGYCAAVNAFAAMDFTDRLAGLRAPTLLVAAENDHGGGPVDAMRAMAAEIGDVRLAIVTGSGHIVNHEEPNLITSLTANHLNGL